MTCVSLCKLACVSHRIFLKCLCSFRKPYWKILRNFNISLCPTVQFLKWAERSFQWEIIRTCSIYHQQLSTNLSITSRSNETWNFETTPKKILDFSQWVFCLYALAFPLSFVNPKTPGVGRNPPIGQEIACHFSQDHAMVKKILDFIHKHPKYKLVKSFFLLSWQVFQKFSRDGQKNM